ncbi:MAG: hypothetical protein HYY18_00730 [Planctomycetes bacterium]|nr:hypothetical protein [Planctomycetota bacterium]
MSLEFTCPCGRALQVGAELAGKRVRCPACRMIVWAPVEDVPVAQLAPEAEPRVVDPPPPAPRPKFRLGPPEVPSPPRTLLSRTANVLAVAGFVVFGLALIAVAFRPGAGPGRPLLLGAAAFFLVLAGSRGARASSPPASASAPAAVRSSGGSILVLFAILAGLAGLGALMVVSNAPSSPRRGWRDPARQNGVRYAAFTCEGRLRAAAESIDEWQRAHDGAMPPAVAAVSAADGAFTCPSGLAYVYRCEGNSSTIRCPHHHETFWRITPDDPR